MSQQPTDRPPFPGKPARPGQHVPAPGPTSQRALPRCKLILHHSDGLELMFIVRTVMELTRLCRAEATHRMWEAYHCGRSVILVTYRERCELFAELFTERGLTVSIENE